MIDLAFLVVFLGLPTLAFLLVRSTAWIVVATAAVFAVFGAAVTFGIELGHAWSMRSLQFLTLLAALTVVVAALLQHRRGLPSATPIRRQFLAVLGPVLLGFALLAAIRVFVAPRAGLFTAVGFLIARPDAEDNAKWLDFTAQLITGDPVSQAVATGGPLQLYLVVVSTALAALSSVVLGGVNEVFVASNAVVYGQYAAAILVPFALAPLVEARLHRNAKDDGDRAIPVPLILTGAFILFVASLSVSGLGHLTLQIAMLLLALWASVFLVGTRLPHAHTYASVGAAAAALVWFPLAPVAVLTIALGIIVLVVRGRRVGARVVAWPAVVVVLFTILSFETMANALRYMTGTEMSASGAIGGAVRGVVAAVRGDASVLLNSQGGTQQVGAVLGVLVAVVALAAVYVVASGRLHRRSPLLTFAPLIVLGGYALLITVVGTWYVGSGPHYGAMKTSFLVSTVALATLAPIALLALDAHRAGVTLLRVGGIVAILYMLAVDTLLPRAFVYVSPQAWPSSSGDATPAFWAPAEVRRTGDQTIASNPIACAFREQGAVVPTALPDGKLAYSCTRILVGLGGADTTGQALPDWLRREWFTNEGAWDQEYPGLIAMPEELRQRDIILLDYNKNVIGLEPVQYFLDRQKPPWAQ